MGLDMMAGVKRTGESSIKEFTSWRKHPSLHGWMHQLHIEKGGDSNPNEFNMVDVELVERDILRLRGDIMMSSLPDTNGFFFGPVRTDEEQRRIDLQFTRTALEYVREGHQVFYSSWW